MKIVELNIYRIPHISLSGLMVSPMILEVREYARYTNIQIYIGLLEFYFSIFTYNCVNTYPYWITRQMKIRLVFWSSPSNLLEVSPTDTVSHSTKHHRNRLFLSNFHVNVSIKFVINFRFHFTFLSVSWNDTAYFCI